MVRGMGSHQSARMKNDEWLTPPHVLKALGEFDLDPCAPITRPWEIAKLISLSKTMGSIEIGLVIPTRRKQGFGVSLTSPNLPTLLNQPRDL